MNSFLDVELADSNLWISPLDTARFGMRIAKIDDESALHEQMLHKLRDAGVKMIISRVDSSKIALINRMEAMGFRIKDVQLTWRFDLNKQAIHHDFLNPGIVVREATVEDIPALQQVAALCFWNYGHYFADDRLDRATCIEVYKDWTARAVRDKCVAEKFLVACSRDAIMGMLFMGLKMAGSDSFAFGGLGAVNPEYQGGNIFSTLVIRSLEWGKMENQTWQEHNVLHNNFPVNRVFSKLGFRLYKSEATLHCWLDENGS
jgi:hypothetical protein